MGCCASAPEQPRKKSNSMSYTNQGGGGGGGPVGGANSYQHKPMNAGGYPPSAAYPSNAAPRGPGYNMGGPPQIGGGAMVPQVGGAVPHIGGGGTMGGGRSALMFIGLYRYEARTPEDLSFDKGQSTL